MTLQKLQELHDTYLRHELVQNPEFEKCITNETTSGNQWKLRLSYTDQNHHRIEDYLEIEVVDHHRLPHVICTLTRTPRHGGHRQDMRELLFKPGKWLGPELYVFT